MNYKMVALDLDGTLTNSRKKITENTKNVLSEAIEKGVEVVLASGRPVIGMNHLAKELGLNHKGGYILSNNGGIIIDCKTEKVIYQKLIDQKYYEEIYNAVKDLDVSILTYDNKYILTETSDNKYVNLEAKCCSAKIREVSNLLEAIEGEVPKFLVVGNPKIMEHIKNQLKTKFKGKLDVYLSQDCFCEIVPIGIEKASGIQKILDFLDLKKEQVIAVGDGFNDIPMLEFAGLSVVMGNACNEVKNYAHYITKTNDEDGVAYALKKFIIN